MHMQSFAYWGKIWKQSPIILACMDSKNGGFRKKLTSSSSSHALAEMRIVIFSFTESMFSSVLAPKGKTLRIRQTWRTALGWVFSTKTHHQMFECGWDLNYFVTDLLPSLLQNKNGKKQARCEAGKYKELSNPFFFLTLPKTDGDFSVRNFAMIGICACIIPSAATLKCSRVPFFSFFLIG